MLPSMKRSVSPQTVTEPEGGPVPKKRRFFGVISTLASRLFSKQEDASQKAPVFSSHNEQGTEELPSEFVSQKRRLSVLGSLKNINDAVPRKSFALPHHKGYQDLAQSFQRQKDEYNGASEHERRNSLFPPVAPDSALDDQEESVFLKDLSPNLNSMPRQSILPTMDHDMEYNNSDDYDANPHNELVEQEFAPLYEDDDGNLVRPPVINLDPSERYHLLQLKRSVEMSEYLQSRLKYMVDPDETTSIPISDTKVSSTTQTSGVDGFDRRLNFNHLRSKMARTRKQRQQRKGKGFFLGEFYYQPAGPKKVEPVSSGEALKGYLGEVKKPQFEEKKSDKPKPLFPDQDTTPKFGLDKNRRADLGPLVGKRDEPELDKDYLDKTESLIKMKEANDGPVKKPAVGPSSGFNFEINKNSLGSILQRRKDDDERVEKASAAADNKTAEEEGKNALFGLASQPKKTATGGSEEAKPAFLFGSKSASESKTTDSLLSDPTKLADKKDETPKPAFSFGQPSSKPLFSAKDDSEKKEKTTFSFGKSDSKPLFGGSNSLEDKTEKDKEEKTSEAPKFSFGGAKSLDSAPKFSFETPKTEASSTMSPFGGSTTVNIASTKTDPPKFLFGLSTEKEDETDDGPRKKRQAPLTFDFGKTEKTEEKSDAKPRFSFGKSNESANSTIGDASKNEAPLFSFGEKKETTPLFSFGGNEKKADTPLFDSAKKDAPTFNFGGAEKKDNASLFKLGSAATTESAPFKVGETSESKEASKEGQKEDTPKFSFGSSSTKDSTPSFSFGPKSDETKLNEKKPEAPALSTAPKFSFEKPKSEEPQNTTEAPKFSFGATKSEEPQGSTEAPKFSFGATKSEEPQNSTEAPKFSFGTTKSVSPSFTFGTSKPGETSFGGAKADTAKESTPVFSVSSKETTPKPFVFGEPAAKPSFNFGSTQTPAFGGDSKNASTFSFGKPETPLIGGPNENAAAPTPAFSFGLAATADPALIFGASKPATQAPAFGGPSAGGSTSFNFGATQAPAFGGPSGAFGGPNPASAFNFGANTNLAAPQPTQSPFAALANTSSVFGSRGSTPGAPGNNTFGQPGAGMANPASVFGANPTQSSGGFGIGTNGPQNQFNSAPGSLGAGSRENTPPVFGAGAPPPGAPGAPGAFGPAQLFTPPLAMKGRRIAQMRPRRR